MPLSETLAARLLAKRYNPKKLTQAVEFLVVLRQGYRRTSTNFAAQAIVPAQEKGFTSRGARLGLIASRKASPRAVDRNRGKRLAREIFRSAASALPPLDVVLRLKNNLRGADNQALRAELLCLLRDIARRASDVNAGTPAKSVNK